MVFVVTVALTSALLVMDDGTIGLGRARWQLWRNVLLPLTKLLALPLAAVAFASSGPSGLLWSRGSLERLYPPA